MRIALISDIHSNLQALRKALSLIRNMFVDEIYCLGDIVGYGANPNECVELVRKYAKYTVLGNHDHAVLNPGFVKYLPKAGEKAALWTADVITTENRQFLKELEYVVNTDICTLVHASPALPAQWTYIRSVDDASPQFEFFKTRVCFIGHTHHSFICGDDLEVHPRLNKENRYLINPGSVGQPRDGRPQLSFGIFDTEMFSYWNYRFSYDVQGAADAIRRNKLPQSLAERLFVGR
jgi:predicted phosphodiesterase